MTLRVALVAPHLEHAISGEETSLRALEAGLRGAGVEVSLRLPPLGPAAGGAERPLLRYRRIRRLLGGLAADPDPPDIYHLFLPTAGLAWTTAPLQNLARPWVLTFEGRLVGEEWTILLGMLRRYPAYALARLALNSRLAASFHRPAAAAFVVPTVWQRDEILALGYDPTAVHVIPNLVETGRNLGPAGPDPRSRLGLPARRFILYLGHFLPSKGVPFLVEAFADLCVDFPDVDLLLAWSHVGTGNDVEEAVARRGVTHRVRIIGPLDPHLAYALADVVVLPYATTHGHSMLPATILEAMAAGRPVLLPAHPVFESLDGAVETFPLGDRAGLSNSLRRLLADPAHAADIGRRARARYLETFAPDRVIPRYLDLYRDVL